jgi:hypothetical protein
VLLEDWKAELAVLCLLLEAERAARARGAVSQRWRLPGSARAEALVEQRFVEPWPAEF